jgi:DNA invertase Pin-like site-specific DNA recombinase
MRPLPKALYRTFVVCQPWFFTPIQCAQLMLALLAEMARNESETLRERIKSGLAHARKRGVVRGRRKGTTQTRDQFLQKHKDILRQLKAGQSVRNVAKIVGKGISTVQRVKAALAA